MWKTKKTDLEGFGRRNFLVAFPEELLDESSDVTASEGDVLDAASDDVPLGHWDYMGDAVARVDDGSGQGPLGDLLGRPARRERKDRLDRNVQPRNVESLEHDLGEVLAVLRGVEWRLGHQEEMVFWLGAKVLEDRLLPEHLHVSPVVNLPVPDRVAQFVRLGRLDGLLSDVKVQVFDPFRSHTRRRLCRRDH